MTDAAAVSAPASAIAPGCPLYDALLALKAQGLSFTDCLYAFGESDENPYVAAARDQARDGELEVDETTVVSEGADAGAYVGAWLWVSDEDAGIGADNEAQQEATADATAIAAP